MTKPKIPAAPAAGQARAHSERRLALVTGGSRGLGLELARELARRNYDLLLVARNQTDLDRAARSLESENDCRVFRFAVDLTSAHGPRALFDWTKDNRIAVQVLVNNAGMGDYGDIAMSDPERQQAMLGLNVVSLTTLTQWLPTVSVQRVARLGVRAMLHGRVTTVPGIVNRINAVLGELPPRGIAQAVFAFLSRHA